MKADTVFTKTKLLNISAQLYIRANNNLCLLYIRQFTLDIISQRVSLYKSSDRAALWCSDKIH